MIDTFSHESKREDVNVPPFRVLCQAFVVPSIPWCLSTLDIYTHNTLTHHAHCQC